MSHRKGKITPLLQQQLMRQMAKVADALDRDLPAVAYRCLKTLVIESPEPVKQKVLDDLGIIDQELIKAQARKSNTGDLYLSRVDRRDAIILVFRRRLWPLFEKVMFELYDGGYMEDLGRPVDTNVPESFFGKK